MSLTATMTGSFNKLEVFQLFCQRQKWSQPVVVQYGSQTVWMTNVTGKSCDKSRYSRENIWIDAETGAVSFDGDYRRYLQPCLDKLYDPEGKDANGVSHPSNEWNRCDVQITLQREGLREGQDFDFVGEGDNQKIRLFSRNQGQLAEASLGE